MWRMFLQFQRIQALLKNYYTNKESWLWPSLKGHKRARKVTIKFVWDIDVENIHIKFWKDSCIPQKDYCANKVSGWKNGQTSFLSSVTKSRSEQKSQFVLKNVYLFS